MLFALSNNASAQVNAYTKYDTCQYLKQYEGTWMSAVGLDTIRIYLRYNRTWEPYFNTVLDRLWGWHEFKQGHKVVESNYSRRFMTIPFDESGVSLDASSIIISLKFCEKTASGNYLSGIIRDSSASEVYMVKATLYKTKTVMKWKQDRSEFFGTDSLHMTLPSRFVLIKQP